MKRSFLALIIVCSQLLGQDRDLPGYKLAFEDNFDTLSVGPDTSGGLQVVELEGGTSWDRHTGILHR